MNLREKPLEEGRSLFFAYIKYKKLNYLNHVIDQNSVLR